MNAACFGIVQKGCGTHSPPPDGLLTLIGPNDSGFSLVRSGSKLPAAVRCTMQLPDPVTSRMRERADCQYGTVPSPTALLTPVAGTRPQDAQFCKLSNQVQGSEAARTRKKHTAFDPAKHQATSRVVLPTSVSAVRVERVVIGCV